MFLKFKDKMLKRLEFIVIATILHQGLQLQLTMQKRQWKICKNSENDSDICCHNLKDKFFF